MREPVRDPGRLEHILEAIDRIFAFMETNGRDEIEKDSILYYAVVKNIEIIGEAAYKLSLEFKANHPGTDWRTIVGMRHFLVHEYYQVLPEEVWNVVEKELQPLKEQVLSYLKELQAE